MHGRRASVRGGFHTQEDLDNDVMTRDGKLWTDFGSGAMEAAWGVGECHFDRAEDGRKRDSMLRDSDTFDDFNC